MKKGDIEIGEIIFIFLIVCGLVLATYMISYSEGNDIYEDRLYRYSAFENFDFYPDSSIGSMMDEGMKVCDGLFFSETESGDFTIYGYSWVLGDRSNSPDTLGVVGDDLRTSAALFDDRYVSSLRGFGFKVYESENDTPMKVFGFGIFNSNSTKLDGHDENNTMFSVRYYPDQGDYRRLESCRILERETFVTENENQVSVYFFKCALMWED